MKLDLILTGEPVAQTLTEMRTHDGLELRLADIRLHETVELVRIDLSPEEMEPLLERGVLPGCQLCPVRRSPAGDPIVRIDGSLLAIRREMAGCLCVRRAGADAA